MDSDRDGFVSLAECLSHEREKVGSIDTDGSGSLSKAEMEMEERRRPNVGGRDRPNRFARLDADHNGAVSVDEYLADEKGKVPPKGCEWRR